MRRRRRASLRVEPAPGSPSRGWPLSALSAGSSATAGPSATPRSSSGPCTAVSVATDASALFARNLYNFLSAFWDKDAGAPLLPDDDEIVKGVRLTKSGKVVSERLSG